MDQLICASLSHTHNWYEVGMLKVPAYSSAGGQEEYCIDLTCCALRGPRGLTDSMDCSVLVVV